jgi:signal transduction histidine kinase
MPTQLAQIVNDVGVALESLLKGIKPAKIDISRYELKSEIDLARVANQLIDNCTEVRLFVLALSQGQLKEFSPCKENVLAWPFKELHARLKHLTWQTQRIAEGDFKQRVDFMGEFSMAFNAMVEKLAQREAQLADAGAQLERMVEELRRSNERLQQFAYVVSHDLKAPLRGIKSLASWIVEDCADKLDESGTEQLHLLTQRVNRMQGLIDGILEYSRLDSVKSDQSRVDLDKVVRDIIDLLSPPENISVILIDKLPVVICDSTRITQVFQNLISNAIKYMDKPKGEIKIGCVSQKNFWKFTVNDNGPGIEEKDFDKIFQLFQTLQANKNVDSTGVGLSIVKKIVEDHGGKIGIVSELHQGSTFWFTLPKTDEAEGCLADSGNESVEI